MTQRRLKRWRVALALAASLCFAGDPASAQQSRQRNANPGNISGSIAGTVASEDGKPISDASVELHSVGAITPNMVQVAANGRFAFSGLPPGSYIISASAAGFVAASRNVTVVAGAATHVNVSLPVLSMRQTAVVSATETPEPLDDMPAPITVLDAANINQSAAPTLDDFLRQVPSFSLFRRTSSMVSQPTTNGVSLRGIGASGVSRTLVLLDGIPFNDPVGSWVYGDQVPAIAVQNIEIAPGGILSLYGSSAMAGVIDITTRKPAAPTLDVSGLAGWDGTGDLDYLAGTKRGRLSYSSAGSLFRTNGYTLVPKSFRGAVDIPAGSQNETIMVRAGYEATRNTDLFLAGRFFNERRGNGTLLQNNSTREGLLHAGLRSHAVNGNEWRANFFAFDQMFHSSFSSVALNRDSEKLALLQTEPAHGWGANVQWSRPLSGRNLVSVGGDARWTYARDEERAFSSAGVNTTDRRIPGEQFLGGAFVQDFWTPSQRLNFILGARADTWRNYDASLTQLSPRGRVEKATVFPTASKSIVTPHAGVVLHVTPSLSLRAAFYQGFRAPTLDELYRSFRVGNILTEANPSLGPERLTGYEFGFNQRVAQKFYWRMTGFSDRLNDPVSNVTLSVTPSLITRERDNLGRVDVKGIGLDASYEAPRHFQIEACYVFSKSTVASFAANPALVGNLLPQVPEHRASVVVTHPGPWHLSSMLEGRYESNRFDDDQNRLRLGSFFVLDAKLARSFCERWTPFIEVRIFLTGNIPSPLRPCRKSARQSSCSAACALIFTTDAWPACRAEKSSRREPSSLYFSPLSVPLCYKPLRSIGSAESFG